MVLTKTNVIWIDEKFVPWDEARVHVLSHSLHYGTGVFEGMRVYDTARGPMGFRFRDHIQRLFDSAFLLRMEMSYSQQDFMNFCKETVRANAVRSCYVRPLVFRGYGEMGLNPLSCPVNCVIAVWP
ncbi:MAG: aminotransferase class IV, partial [Candidatus Bathyarchaeia archaeon]